MSTQLAELTTDTALTVFTGDNGLDSYVQQVTDEVNNFEHDLSTAAGRKRTISLAGKVASIKVKYDDYGKGLVAGWKKNASKVDKARKKMRDELDALKVLARKPVTDWEDEQKKIEAEKQLKLEAEMLSLKTEADHEIALFMNADIDRETARVEDERLAAVEVEQARLKQVQIDRDIAVAAEATAAAERLAQKAIDDAQEAKQKAIDDKIKADAELVAANAREKLLNEQAAQNKLNAEWLAYISEAYQINDDINSKAEQAAYEAIAEQLRLKSIEDERLAGIERQRVEAENKKAAQDKLEANKKHVGSVRGEIKAHLMNTCGVDEELAVSIVKALLTIKTRVTINY